MKRLKAEKETVSYWRVTTIEKIFSETDHSPLQDILWSFAALLFVGVITYSFLMYFLAPKE